MLNQLKTHKDNHPNEEGFTLIELMIVVVIIGILAAIAIPIFANQQKAAHDATLKQDLKTTNTAMLTWLTKGNKIADAPLIDTTYSYILKYNNGDPTAWPGSNGTTTKIFFPGIPDFTISEGSRIAIKVTKPEIGYCIAGAKDGANYNSINPITGNPSDPYNMLFYDSATGKTTNIDALTKTGACEYFAK